MVRNYVKRVSKLNDVTLRIDGTGKLNYPDIQTVIKNYGIVTEWNQSHGGSILSWGMRNSSFSAKITLLYPTGTFAVDQREVRQELYLQAESIIETMKMAGFQFTKPPRIILDGHGYDGQVEGTIEVDYSI